MGQVFHLFFNQAPRTEGQEKGWEVAGLLGQWGSLPVGHRACHGWGWETGRDGAGWGPGWTGLGLKCRTQLRVGLGLRWVEKLGARVQMGTEMAMSGIGKVVLRVGTGKGLQGKVGMGGTEVVTVDGVGMGGGELGMAWGTGARLRVFSGVGS